MVSPAKLMFYNPLRPTKKVPQKVQSYTRRQLKEDKFAKGTKEAVDWATEHRQLLILGSGVIIAAALLVTGFLAWSSRQNEHANTALSKALQTLGTPLRAPGAPVDPAMKTFASIAERGKEAQKELTAVADQYPHTQPGKIAGYLAGTAALQAGDNAAAEQLFKSAAGAGDKNLAALGKLALANFYRSSNRAADAAKLYKELIDNPTDTVSKSEAQLNLAELYEATNPTEAANIYQQIQKENPQQSEAAQIAGAKLSKAGKSGR